MLSSDDCGRPRTNVASWSPLTVTSLTFWYQMARGFLRKSSAVSLPVSLVQVHCTSLAVNALPSCHFTPWRSLNVSLVLESSQAQLSARSGTMVSVELSFLAWSNITRLLNTAMNGCTVEMVASSWMDPLGRLSRW